MITVTIFINGNPVFTRSAVNTGETDARWGSADDDVQRVKTKYKVDDGSDLWHAREDGAVPLAIQMLKTIKEQK